MPFNRRQFLGAMASFGAFGAANVPSVCGLAANRLKATGKLRIEVSPRNSFGKAGAPISTTFAAHV